MSVDTFDHGPASPHLRATAAALLLREGYDLPEEHILECLGVLLHQVQAACGELDGGHDWEHYDNGDPATPFYSSYTACAICGAPCEPEDGV